MADLLTDQDLDDLRWNYAHKSDGTSWWVCRLIAEVSALRADRDAWEQRQIRSGQAFKEADELWRNEKQLRERAETDRDAARDVWFRRVMALRSELFQAESDRDTLAAAVRAFGDALFQDGVPIADVKPWDITVAATEWLKLGEALARLSGNQETR